MIFIIFLISFCMELLASYRVIYLARNKLHKAGLIDALEMIFSLTIIRVLVIQHWNFGYILIAALGAYCGVICDVGDVMKWIKKNMKKQIIEKRIRKRKLHLKKKWRKFRHGHTLSLRGIKRFFKGR